MGSTDDRMMSLFQPSVEDAVAQVVLYKGYHLL